MTIAQIYSALSDDPCPGEIRRIEESEAAAIDRARIVQKQRWLARHL